MKKIFLSLTLITLASCGTVSKNIPDKANLASNEGVLLTRVSCADTKHISMTTIFEKGQELTDLKGFEQNHSAIIRCTGSEEQNRIRVITLPEGDYYFGALLTTKINIEDAYQFKIERHKINYIGDMYVNTDVADSKTLPIVVPGALVLTTSTQFNAILHVQDKENGIKQAFSKQYPQLSSEYTFTKNIAKY